MSLAKTSARKLALWKVKNLIRFWNHFKLLIFIQKKFQRYSVIWNKNQTTLTSQKKDEVIRLEFLHAKFDWRYIDEFFTVEHE